MKYRRYNSRQSDHFTRSIKANPESSGMAPGTRPSSRRKVVQSSPSMLERGIDMGWSIDGLSVAVQAKHLGQNTY